VRAAHHFAKVQAVVVRNLPPAFVALELAYDGVEALPRRISQQMRLLQSTPAKSGRCSLCLQRSDGNPRFRRNFIQIRSARSNSAKHQNECRYEYTYPFHIRLDSFEYMFRFWLNQWLPSWQKIRGRDDALQPPMRLLTRDLFAADVH